MVKSLIRLLFGDKQKRDMKRIMPLVAEVNKVSADFEKLSDDDLRIKTHQLRRLLHVAPRFGRAMDGTVVNHPTAEAFLSKHPDVANCVFVGSRRDAAPGQLVVFIQLREGVKPSADLGEQVRGGMGRLGEAYKPASAVFLEELPLKEGTDGFDYHRLSLAAEECEFEPWEDLTWAEVKSMIKEEGERPVALDEVLPEAFAAVKEACRRHVGKKWIAGGAEIAWQMVPFDVQLAGGIALHQGNISEMGTGEGKTLVAIFPLYLNALPGRGAHLVTVNDYLSKRDSEWMTPIFEFLGMTVGCIDKSDSHTAERRAAYWCDVTYGTNNEFGFDYLRDNMALDREQLVQREHHYAIIDEADSVLIDEARTPLIIAGPVERSTDQYDRILPSVRDLVGKQQMLVNKLMKEAQDFLEADPQSYEAGIKLLQGYKGSPKHNRYMKLREEPRSVKLQERVEIDFMRDKKMRELEAELFFVVDEKHHSVDLTDKGREALSPTNPEYFVLSDIVDEFAKIEQTGLPPGEKEQLKLKARAQHDAKAEELHSISQLLFAFVLKRRDVDYVVEENKVVIVDEFTGRKMAGRRWSDGLHQAVEAKEGVKIEKETQTLATITIQNFFRMYPKAGGMTGTAETEAGEFAHTYKMDVVVIPPNKPTKRKDLDDVIFRTKREKYAAVLDEIERLYKMGMPVLVGTTSVAVSETVSRMLKGKKLPHAVLNAKNHAKEAEIVAEAGRKAAITIATNMAGRGTDIKLGPGAGDSAKDEEGADWPGGLQIIGTERHEARRIDRQLRGRSGRQGDPGTSRFFLSLEDDLMLWFGGERLAGWMTRLGMKEGEPIIHPMVTRAVEKAQRKIEAINQERRKRTLDYDNVMNKQREAIYGLRRALLQNDELRDTMMDVFADAISMQFAAEHGNPEDIQTWDLEGFFDWIHRIVMDEAVNDLRHGHFQAFDDLLRETMGLVVEAYDIKREMMGPLMINNLSRYIALNAIDTNWQDHLLAIDDLREGIHLRSVGQRDPLVEYTRDATSMFTEMMTQVNTQAFDRFFRTQLAGPAGPPPRRIQRVSYSKPEAAPALSGPPEAGEELPTGNTVEDVPKLGTYRRESPKVGRNDPCPCGSGKKFKVCCGAESVRERVDHSLGGDGEG